MVAPEIEALMPIALKKRGEMTGVLEGEAHADKEVLIDLVVTMNVIALIGEAPMIMDQEDIAQDEGAPQEKEDNADRTRISMRAKSFL